MKKNVFNGKRRRAVRSVLLLLTVTIGGVFRAGAQGYLTLHTGGTDAKMPAVVQPSPNSSSLIRTVSENVDLYTGQLSVSVPLYTLKSRDVELPITLQGTANARRVNDVASWVGLGWHLNAGGAITRVMKNLPDEQNGTISPSFNFYGVGYLNLNTSQHGNIILNRFYTPLPPFTQYTVDEMKTIINEGSWNTKSNPPGRGLDLQPDEFYFNFGNYSGKFVFDQAGQVRLITEANLFITPTITSNKITAFTVTSDDGFVYEFGNYNLNAVEESKLFTQSYSSLFAYRYINQAPQPFQHTIPGVSGTHPVDNYNYEYTPVVMSTFEPIYPGNPANGSFEPTGLTDFYLTHNQNQSEYSSYSSTWYLTKITSPSGDIVNFTYQDNGTLTYLASSNWSESRPLGGKNCPPSNLLRNGFYHHPSLGDLTYSFSTIELKSKRLKEITTQQGYKVEFIATTNRTDLIGDKRLDKMVIQENGRMLKEFEFGYETTHNADAVLKVEKNVLRPVYNYSGGSFSHTSFNGYTVSYTPNIPDYARKRLFLKTVTEKAGSEQIPPYTFEYNDINGLPYRISFKQDFFGFASSVPVVNSYVGPSLTPMLSGTLKSIKYPTGGTKEFTYSVSGNVNSWSGLKVETVKEKPSATATATTKTYTYGTYLANDYPAWEYTMVDAVASFPVGSSVIIDPVESKRFTSNSRVNPENSTRGAAGGYDFVEVTQGNGGGVYRMEFTNGSISPDYADVNTTTYIVSSILADIYPLNTNFPFPQVTSNDWRRGLPLNEYYYKLNGTTRIPVKSTHYNYDFTNHAIEFGSSYGIQPSKYKLSGNSSWNWLLFGRYSYTPRWQVLTSKTEKEYAPDGVAFRENKTVLDYRKFVYSGKSLLYQTETKLDADSRNRQQIQRTRYPLDYGASSDAFGQGIAFLKTKKVLNVPVEQYSFTQETSGADKKYTGGSLNQFYEDKVKPKRSFMYRPAGLPSSFTESAVSGGAFNYDPNYQPEFNYTAYDATGNPTQRNKEFEASESYIWDYNNVYPIAQVTNASLSQVAYTSFEADGKGGWTYSVTPGSLDLTRAVTGRKSYSGTLTKTVPQGTYIVTLWSAVGATASVNGSGGTNLVTKNGYVLKEWRLQSVTSITVSSSNMDEVRLYPAGAQMATMSYDPLIGQTSQCDISNNISYYEYDALGRLSVVRDGDRNVLKKMCYTYYGYAEECRVNTKPVYVRLVKEVTYHYNDDYYVNEASNYIAKFYSDPAGTIPYTLEAPVLVDYKSNIEHSSYASPTFYGESIQTINVPDGVSEYLLTAEENINCRTGPAYYELDCFNLTISLVLRNYTIIP